MEIKILMLFVFALFVNIMTRLLITQIEERGVNDSFACNEYYRLWDVETFVGIMIMIFRN